MLSFWTNRPGVCVIQVSVFHWAHRARMMLMSTLWAGTSRASKGIGVKASLRGWHSRKMWSIVALSAWQIGHGKFVAHFKDLFSSLQMNEATGVRTLLSL